ncbi:MAG TPA: class I SAM-dependent methyltransferase [Gammaproteobacteria bacterium]|nr:class I SAM-dependent methyltransferase [Gammaproteobacteria bacterium]
MSATPTANSVAIACEHGLYSRARTLAEKFGLPLLSRTQDAQFQLFLGATRLELRDLGPDAPGPVFVDYCAGRSDHRRRYGGGKNQPLARAAGLGKLAALSIVDATAGLGRDAFVLASLGCRVTLVERSPAFAALLEDGIERALLDAEVRPIAERMRLIHADSRDYLSRLPRAQRPEVVYLDPMYPHRDKSALVKKEMRYTRALVGDDADAGGLLAVALAAARRRVAVKRPKGAPVLPGPRPTAEIASANTRYDIYTVNPLNGTGSDEQ